jgi:hypothetical protein
MQVGGAEPRAKKLNIDMKVPVTKAVFIDSTWNQSRGIYKDQRVRGMMLLKRSLLLLLLFTENSKV